MRAQKAKPSRQLEDMSDISTSGYWLNSLLHHSCNAATPIISLRKKADSLYTIASKWIDMFYLKIIEQLFLFVEQLDQLEDCLTYHRLLTIECEGWRRNSSLIFLILLLTKPNIEVSGWLYQTKTHFTHIVYQPFSRVSPPSFTLYVSNWNNNTGGIPKFKVEFIKNISKYQNYRSLNNGI